MYTYKKYFSKLLKKYISNPTSCRKYIRSNVIPQPGAGSDSKIPESKNLFSALRNGTIYEKGLALEIILGIIGEDFISEIDLSKFNSTDNECVEYFADKISRYIPRIPCLYEKKLEEMSRIELQNQVCLAIEIALRTDVSKFSVSYLIECLRSEYFFVKWLAKELLLRKGAKEFTFDTLYEEYQKYDNKIYTVGWSLQNMEPAYEAFYSVDGYALMHLLLKHFPEKLESGERYTMRSFVYHTKYKKPKVLPK